MVTPKRLYKGQLGSSAGELYAPGVGKSATVRQMIVVNDQIADRQMTLWLDTSTDADLITPNNFVVPGNASAQWQGVMVVEYGQSIRGMADVANDLTITIHGAENS